MLSDKFHQDTSDGHSSGIPKILNCRIMPFCHEMEECTQSLLTNSKLEILRGGYTRAYYNAIRQVSSRYKRWARFRLAKNPKRRIVQFSHDKGERTQSLRMSSKLEIHQGWYSEAYHNAIRRVSSGHWRPARFRHAKNPSRKIAPFWHEMGERTQSLRMSSKREILRGRYFGAYYNATRQVSSGQ
jgi:hypothetical protein